MFSRSKQLTLISIVGTLFFFGLVIIAGTHASALSVKLFDDNSKDCDVYNWDGSNKACNRKAVLAVADTPQVPDGFTHARLYFKNIPTDGDLFNPQPSTTFNYNQLSFSVMGAAHCPSYFGRSVGGANARDNIYSDSYYDTHALDVGTKVTEYTITQSDGSPAYLSSGNGVIGTKRSGASFCEPSGANYTQTFAVKRSYLRRVPGLLPKTFYIDLLVQVYDGVQRDHSKCSLADPQSCSGIADRFTLKENGPDKFRGLISSGDVNPLNTQAAATYRQVYRVPDGSGGSTKMVNLIPTTNFDQNISVQSNDDVSKNATETSSSHSTHSSYRFGFAPDCTILPQGSSGRDVVLKLYDIDFGNLSDMNQIRVLLLKYDSQGKFAGRLKMQKDVLGYDTHLKQAPAVAVSNTWLANPNPIPKADYYNYGTKIEPGTDSTQGIRFHAMSGERYVFYLLNVRHGLVSQIGLPFDSAYAPGGGVAAGSCQAKLNPDVKMAQYNPTTGAWLASATVENGGTIALSADYVRKVFFAKSDINKTQVGSVLWSETGRGQYSTNPATKVMADVTHLSPGASTRTAAQATAAGATQICTSLTLSNPASSATYSAGTAVQLTDSVLSAVKCRPFTVSSLPFFQVNGGDVFSQGQILGWSNNGTPDYLGAYVQIAALAKDNISGVRSGYGLDSTGFGVGNNGTGLAFANVDSSNNSVDPVATGGIYGGLLTTVPAHAVSDVSTTGPTCKGTVGGGGINDIGTGANYFTINLTGTAAGSGVYCNDDAAKPIYLSGQLAVGKRITIRSKADVYIDSGGITYQAYAVDTVPRLTVVANGGNVYVSGTATEVHGIFYALKLNTETGSSGGDFYTCAESPSKPIIKGFTPDTSTSGMGNNAADFNKCRAALTVYGAVSANRVYMSRNTSGINSLAPVTPAETFVYSPEVWLGDNSPASGYDTFTSLSPIF